MDPLYLDLTEEQRDMLLESATRKGMSLEELIVRGALAYALEVVDPPKLGPEGRKRVKKALIEAVARAVDEL